MGRLGILALALAIGAGAWFVVGPGAGPPIGNCSPVAQSPPGDVPPSNTPNVRWQEAALPDGLDDADEQVMLDVAAFADGFVAVGRSSNGPDWHAFLLRSSDGAAWESDPTDGARFAGTELSALTVAGDRLFAIGSTSTSDRGHSRGAIWFTDDGVGWTEASGPFDETRPRSLAAGADGLLLLGTENAAAEPRAWRSADGESWEAQPLDLPVAEAEAGFRAVAALGDGWHAVGSISRGGNAAAAPVIWRSGDGISWSCHVLDAEEFSYASPHRLYRSGERWLAVGTASDGCGFGGLEFGASCPGVTLAWASDDGLGWSRAITDAEHITSGAIAGTDGGFLAFSRGSAYASTDGISWSRSPDASDLRINDAQADALVVTENGRRVLVGTRYDGSDADLWIAVGEASR